MLKIVLFIGVLATVVISLPLFLLARHYQYELRHCVVNIAVFVGLFTVCLFTIIKLAYPEQLSTINDFIPSAVGTALGLNDLAAIAGSLLLAAVPFLFGSFQSAVAIVDDACIVERYCYRLSYRLRSRKGISWKPLYVAPWQKYLVASDSDPNDDAQEYVRVRYDNSEIRAIYDKSLEYDVEPLVDYRYGRRADKMNEQVKTAYITAGIDPFVASKSKEYQKKSEQELYATLTRNFLIKEIKLEFCETRQHKPAPVDELKTAS